MAAVDTILDTSLARMSESCQNAVTVAPVPANAKTSHFITINRYEAFSPNLSRQPRCLLLFRHSPKCGRAWESMTPAKPGAFLRHETKVVPL
jgi:hypothetical protein